MKTVDTHDRRRRVPRQGTRRSGAYQWKDDLQSAWRDCEVIDISVLGARLKISQAACNDLIGREITVELHKGDALTGAMKRSRLSGVVRDARSDFDGETGVGIQFLGDLPWSEQAVLEGYERMRLSW
jgi:hypothetical protein